MLQNDTVPWRYQEAAWNYSYIGEYMAALKAWNAEHQMERTVQAQADLEASLKDSKIIISGYKPVPAKDHIITAAKKNRLVIINEAHHIPKHRVFVESLLPALKTLGFNYIGVETLDYNDSLLAKRKYPVLKTGAYSQEPCFGNLIRTALQSGYTVFPYEASGDIIGKEREIAQAENIKKLMDQNPQGKFIIYCGFDHAVEDSISNSWILAMAGRLKHITGVDPLTIDQVQLTETGNASYDNVYRQVIDLNYSAVFLDGTGRAFNEAMPSKAFDVNIYHPTTKIINGRPDWLQTKNKRTVDIASKITINYPCLVKAYQNLDDIEKAVPVDVIELKSNQDNKKLILGKRQQYIVVILNKAGQQQIITIK